MTPHDEAITLLVSRGLYAKRRDWAPGQTVIVSRRTVKTGIEGLETLDGVVYLIWQNGVWDVSPADLGIVEHGYPTIPACERAIKYLQTPDNQLWAARKRSKESSGEYWYPDGLLIDTPPS